MSTTVAETAPSTGRSTGRRTGRRDLPDRPKVVVAGTRFGRIYLTAFLGDARDRAPFELAGILSTGSELSRSCADYYGVPLFTSAEDVPDDVDLGAVIVRAGISGGDGAQVSSALMERGIHVVQEHQLHPDELRECLRVARAHDVVHHVNTFYVHVDPVRRFVAAARRLLADQPALFVDGVCGAQFFYSFLDILGHALGGLRPWAFAPTPELPAALRERSPLSRPFRALDGVIAGVPVSLRVQNQLDPAEPDNHVHVPHRITLGTEGGTLTLVGNQGPVVWTPTFHIPRSSEGLVRVDEADAEHLGFEAVTRLDPPTSATYRELFRDTWAAGVRHALETLAGAVRAGDPPMRQGQYHLSLCRLWQDATTALGYPEHVTMTVPRPLPATDLLAAADAVGPGSTR